MKQTFLEKYFSNLKTEFEKSQLQRIITKSQIDVRINKLLKPLNFACYPFIKSINLLSSFYFQPRFCRELENKLDKITPQYFGGIHNEKYINIVGLPQKLSFVNKIKSFFIRPFIKFRYGKYEYSIEQIENNLLNILKSNKEFFKEIEGEIIDLRNIDSEDVKRNKIQIKCEVQTQFNSNKKNYFVQMKFLVFEKELIDALVIEI